MLILNRDQTAFPRLTAFVHEELDERVQANERVWSAFLAHGQFTEETGRRVLSDHVWGPILRIADLGHFRGKKILGWFAHQFPDWIFLDDALVRQFEKDWHLETAKLTLEAKVLHELVHWGDDQDGVDRAGEEGAEFERLIYGKVMH